MALRRAYTVLSSAELRAEYESKMGLPSARAADPRFARFERWRREVIPDLEYQLEFWSRPVEGYVEAWRQAREQRERTLARLYNACLQSLRALKQLREQELQRQKAAAAAATASAAAGGGAGGGAGAAAAPSAGAVGGGSGLGSGQGDSRAAGSGAGAGAGSSGRLRARAASSPGPVTDAAAAAGAGASMAGAAAAGAMASSSWASAASCSWDEVDGWAGSTGNHSSGRGSAASAGAGGSGGADGGGARGAGAAAAASPASSSEEVAASDPADAAVAAAAAAGGGLQDLLPALGECLAQMGEQVAGFAADTGDGMARVQREVDKRYEQVATRYPAYPDIVWLDVWEANAERWLGMAAEQARGCSEAEARWSGVLTQLREEVAQAGHAGGGAAAGAAAGSFLHAG
ncbi:hypothetical protein HXX76_005373 [Chlamydomonas incerta]|uniref:Uncharacterized protein n=1 Tax=Chlamydomonas incerta TaxID=51695 RepID=A0A835T4L1_CHLIN|nr:hypothetical protein HXX76_005373 [Chlamydomonas incerta]|eukprot:KAG2438832.1 hypothetical protein HXX76_005373 [Chlamydomonas incerta]